VRAVAVALGLAQGWRGSRTVARTDPPDGLTSQPNEQAAVGGVSGAGRARPVDDRRGAQHAVAGDPGRSGPRGIDSAEPAVRACSAGTSDGGRGWVGRLDLCEALTARSASPPVARSQRQVRHHRPVVSHPPTESALNNPQAWRGPNVIQAEDRDRNGPSVGQSTPGGLEGVRHRLPELPEMRGLAGRVEVAREVRDAAGCRGCLRGHPSNVRTARVALCPPNPKLLLSAAVTFFSRAVLGTQSRLHAGS